MSEDKQDNEVTEAKGKISWDKTPKAQIQRVFRAVKPRVMRDKKLITLFTQDHMEKGTTVKGRCIGIKPNPASQYVLNAGAIDYQDQLKALRGFEGKGEIVEVDPKNIGTPFISEEEKELALVERRFEELKAKLGVTQ